MRVSRSTFFQCSSASASFSRSTSTHFPLSDTRPPTDCRSCWISSSGQRFAVERDIRGELEQRRRVQGAPLAGVDLDVDHGTGRAIRLPPVRHPDDQAALLEDRDVLEESIRLARGPGQRVIDLARVDHLLDQFASLGRALDRQQERQQRRAILRPRVLLQGLPQGLVLHASLGRQPGDVGRQEREGMIRVALVLGEVERHAADESPLGIELAQVGLHALRMVRDLVADEGVELGPPGGKNIRVKVFAPLHRRSLEDLERKVRRGRYGDRGDRARGRLRRRLAETRQVKPREIACEAERRGQARLQLGRRQMQESAGRALLEGGGDTFPDRAVQPGAGGLGRLAHMEMALRREEEFKRHEPLSCVRMVRSREVTRCCCARVLSGERNHGTRASSART